ncbi:hypothetical protein TNCV_1587491 [Trichonephila clavipes]|uniref:Uncharacterized protein n=1 Tax=Trichonephila clavipes TaxID=2585209 RepID=A0A8X6UUV7_TRICX|nr:hypothetical protein TNCV_1587491 [Trichonephila clavipes]
MCLILFETESSQDITSAREPDSVEVCSGGCLNSQFRAIAGRADYQYLLSLSVGVWRKFHLSAGIAVGTFFPTAAVNVLSTIQASKEDSFQSSLRRCSINMFF